MESDYLHLKLHISRHEALAREAETQRALRLERRKQPPGTLRSKFTAIVVPLLPLKHLWMR